MPLTEEKRCYNHSYYSTKSKKKHVSVAFSNYRKSFLKKFSPNLQKSNRA